MDGVIYDIMQSLEIQPSAEHSQNTVNIKQSFKNKQFSVAYSDKLQDVQDEIEVQKLLKELQIQCSSSDEYEIKDEDIHMKPKVSSTVIKPQQLQNKPNNLYNTPIQPNINYSVSPLALSSTNLQQKTKFSYQNLSILQDTKQFSKYASEKVKQFEDLESISLINCKNQTKTETTYDEIIQLQLAKTNSVAINNCLACSSQISKTTLIRLLDQFNFQNIFSADYDEFRQLSQSEILEVFQKSKQLESHFSFTRLLYKSISKEFPLPRLSQDNRNILEFCLTFTKQHIFQIKKIVQNLELEFDISMKIITLLRLMQNL
ncbi:hypothetical protein SS50377_27523 [Spironucleus salmonicida]|uniref:Uncharacterized protein n=1 Tax=Spironucleus salmonicida TaxID=348837 RepID=V6M138_9EUKA|nr:hypothetical protein SS50377_27523 [Spironucleus salmonicida]|eukprot:EST46884.1 Hypothetical protein SS50377_13036 [Spironucleus salmonicida]